MTKQLYYFWLGADAKRAADEYETQRQLERELPALDATGEDG
jgi:hypothetical protein